MLVCVSGESTRYVMTSEVVESFESCKLEESDERARSITKATYKCREGNISPQVLADSRNEKSRIMRPKYTT